MDTTQHRKVTILVVAICHIGAACGGKQQSTSKPDPVTKATAEKNCQKGPSCCPNLATDVKSVESIVANRGATGTVEEGHFAAGTPSSGPFAIYWKFNHHECRARFELYLGRAKRNPYDIIRVDDRLSCLQAPAYDPDTFKPIPPPKECQTRQVAAPGKLALSLQFGAGTPTPAEAAYAKALINQPAKAPRRTDFVAVGKHPWTLVGPLWSDAEWIEGQAGKVAKIVWSKAMRDEAGIKLEAPDPLDAPLGTRLPIDTDLIITPELNEPNNIEVDSTNTVWQWPNNDLYPAIAIQNPKENRYKFAGVMTPNDSLEVIAKKNGLLLIQAHWNQDGDAPEILSVWIIDVDNGHTYSVSLPNGDATAHSDFSVTGPKIKLRYRELLRAVQNARPMPN